MVNSVAFLLAVITLLQGCSSTTQIEYTYPKNQEQTDADNVGSLVPGGGLYLVKPSMDKTK